MKRLTILAVLVALLTLALPNGVALGQQPPPGPSVRYQTKYEVTNAPAQLEVAQLVVDFAPGVWTPPHTHGGQLYDTVIEGEITVRGKGGEHKYPAGQTFVENFGDVYEIGNTSEPKARVLVTALLPKGAALTTVAQTTSQQAPPGPTTVYQYRTEAVPPSSQFDLIHQVLDFAPGAYTPAHYHGGQTFVTVVEGEQIVRQNGTERRLKAGESWGEAIGQVGVAGNPGPAKLSVVATILLPKGAQLTTVVEAGAAAPTTLPQTGEGAARAMQAWLLVLGGGGVIASGWWMRRRAGRA